MHRRRTKNCRTERCVGKIVCRICKRTRVVWKLPLSISRPLQETIRTSYAFCGVATWWWWGRWCPIRQKCESRQDARSDSPFHHCFVAWVSLQIFHSISRGNQRQRQQVFRSSPTDTAHCWHGVSVLEPLITQNAAFSKCAPVMGMSGVT